MQRNSFFNSFVNETGLYMLYGREKMGKTILAMNMIDKSIDEDSGFLYMYSKPIDNALTKSFDSSYIKMIDMEDVKENPIELLFLEAKMMKEDHNLSLVIIDDFDELLRYTGFRHIEPKRKERIAYLLVSLKCLAQLMDIPVVIISDAEKYLDSKKDKHPNISDMKDKKIIKEFVDKLILMYVDSFYDPNTELKGLAEFSLCDLKSGEVKNHRLAYISESMKYCELDRHPNV